MNPNLEKPTVQVTCPECNGAGILYPKDRMMRQCCPVCGGDCVISIEAADARDDAAETRWEAARGK